MVQQAEPDAVAEFEHNHGRINELVFRVRDLLRPPPGSFPPRKDEETRFALGMILTELREELLTHFAREEEGLFPFVRTHFPEHRDAVDRIEAAHDSICGAIVCLAHLAEHGSQVRSQGSAMRAVFERFERAYAAHGKDEGDLLRQLGRRLESRHRAELAALVRGL